MHSKTIGYSGTDKACQLFAKYLDKTRFDPYILYRENDAANNRLDIIRSWIGADHVVPYNWVPGRSGRVPPYWPEQENFGEMLAKIDPQIVHVHRSGYAEWPINKNYAPKAKWIETNIFGFNDVTNPRQIDLNIYISEFVKRAAIKAGNKPGPVLFNPIEMPALDMTPANKRACRERLLRRFGMPDDAVIMGRVGRPDNFDPIALRAMKKIQPSCPQLFYLIVNSCENWRNEVTNLRLENIHFLNPIIQDEELSHFYMGLDFYAHARSDGEMCPTNIQEAMMHGLAVISHYSAIYNGQPEIIESGGFCVPLGDAEGYAKILEQLVLHQDVRDHFGREARCRAMRDFEASCIVSKLERIYDWVLNEKN